MGTGFGIDIGGTGIKGAPVDLAQGVLAGERVRIPTPQPATVPAVLDTVVAVVEQAGWDGPLGCTFPGIVRHGVVGSAANVDHSWIGTDLAAELSGRLGHPVTVLNDADAAGIAEMRFGAGRGVAGVVLIATLGTGIGTALFVDGRLVPNTEFGHLEIDGYDAEKRAASSVKTNEGLSYGEWSTRLQRYFSHVEALLSPDLIIVGGGISKKADKFLPRLELQAPIVPAQLLNQSGIVGAAVSAMG
ncbi:polyphosphate--glucose phosphotransferase [Micropruina sp.]|uniref:polyphosphate--glucose phosphotransferase n=1 Tax=Micropruina sp. TaxID=2737536 RepID=UPI00261B7EEC|nr:ROK family protein [Micropruina sp.]